MAASTVVVVQSGDLAAWVGALSGLAGVVLGAGIDAMRRRHAEKTQLMRRLVRAGTELANAAASLHKATGLAGRDWAKPEWAAIMDARQAVVTAALATIAESGSLELTSAAADIVRAAAAELPAAEQISAQQQAVTAYATVLARVRL